MEHFKKITLSAALLISFIFIRYDGASQNNEVIIYKVKASTLVVRSEQNSKSKALFNVPKDSYVLNDTSMQSQQIEVISNIKGRWINYCGQWGDTIGYVFEGFLERDDSVKYRNFDNCTIKGMSINCDSDVFTYTSDTPISGAYFKNPDTESGDITFFYKKKPALLKTIIDKNCGMIVMIVRDKKVLQFISTPPARGYE